MKFIIRFWKHILHVLIAGTTSLFIAACYGMPTDISFAGRWTIGVRDKDNKPIPGLLVHFIQYDTPSDSGDTITTEITDSLGFATSDFYNFDDNPVYSQKAIIRDIDSTENVGDFADTLVVAEIPIVEEISDTTNVIMREKK